MVALRKGDLTLPEVVECRILGADVHGGRLGQVAPCGGQVALFVGLQSAEIGDLLQRRPDVGILRGHRLDGAVGGVVVVRIVVGGDEQRARLRGPRRGGIALQVAREEVDRPVEGPAAQFILQLGVVEEGILGNRSVELLVGRHGEGLHRPLLVARAQVAVGQVVGGILRQLVLGAARLAQPLGRLGIARRAVERETLEVAVVAVRLAARLRIGLEMFERAVVVVQMEPRLGNDPLELRTAFGHRAADQLVAVVDNVAVVALEELDLEQVVRHDRAVGVALLQGREALPRPAVAPLRVVDVGAVVERMVGIFAAVADAVEMVVGPVVVAPGELDIAHADVVLLAARAAQCPVVGPLEVFARTPHVANRAVERRQREAHVVAEDRVGIALLELPERRLGIGRAQLHGAGRQVEVDLLPEQQLLGGQRLPRPEKLVPGIAPPAAVEEVAPPVESRGPLRRLRCCGAERQGESQQQDFRFPHRDIFLMTGKDTNFCPSVRYPRNGICRADIVEP